MNRAIKTISTLFALLATAGMTLAQGMKMGEVIMVSGSALKKDVTPEIFQTWISIEIAPSWDKKKTGSNLYLLRADRGDRKGELLLLCSASKAADREALPPGSPFTDKIIVALNASSAKPSDILSNPSSYTEWRLVGADKFKSLPTVGILGIHYIKVKPGLSAEFEKFVIEKLHPAVGKLLPDMQLLYYKAVAGENAGKYITIFAIQSEAARNKYWPAGAPETEILKQAFRPLQGLAKELGSFLVPDSYLAPESGGAAAYFESRTWTDFVIIGL